ncbi:MAG: phospho-N-acetylmuramoyl-pentapeptide-transferase [Alphaproteobacteria bacterium]|nr:phospho-N-acetylmuramoyl-pentapeptide-transferase [Alphaproteobacteria bacterium]
MLNLLGFMNFGLVLRAGAAMMTALAIAIAIGRPCIDRLKVLQKKGQPIRKIGPDHFAKAGTPALGGLFLIAAWFASALLWARLDNQFVWIAFVTALFFAIIGFVDDIAKIKKSSHLGITGKLRLLLEFSACLGLVWWVTHITAAPADTTVFVPFLRELSFNALWFYIPFAMFVIVGTANSVNLTDGLDGLAIGTVIIAVSVFIMFAYVAGNPYISRELSLPHIPGTGELVVFYSALIGAGIGFLWYNCHPAQVFMGDTGSLALGGALGILAVMVKQELLLAIVGALFAVEALSVMIQVAYFRRTGGKRIFLMAPIHHHFEKKGWPETKIVARFWIAGFILAVVGASSMIIGR